MQLESGRIVDYAGSDILHPIRFLSSKEGQDHTVQNRPRSDLNGLVSLWPKHLVWKQASGAWAWQNATGPLPVFHFQTRLRSSTYGPHHAVQNQPRSGLVLADCVGFWTNGSGPEASRCTRMIGPAFGQRFRSDPDRIRYVYWGSTGIACWAGPAGTGQFAPYWSLAAIGWVWL